MSEEKYSRSQDFRIAGMKAVGESVDYSDGEHLEFWEVEAQVRRAEAEGDLQKAIEIRNKYWEKKCGYARDYWAPKPEK